MWVARVLGNVKNAPRSPAPIAPCVPVKPAFCIRICWRAVFTVSCGPVVLGMVGLLELVEIDSQATEGNRVDRFGNGTGKTDLERTRVGGDLQRRIPF